MMKKKMMTNKMMGGMATMPQGYAHGGMAKPAAKKPMPSKGMMPQAYKDGGSVKHYPDMAGNAQCGYRSPQDFGK